MVSKLADSTIQQWLAEGLQPTVKDIVQLNNLGLRLERNSDMYDFAACPRIAFLGDCILREPIIAKQMWIDCVAQLFETPMERLYMIAYALYTLDADLPPLQNAKTIVDEVNKFKEDILLKFTDTQIMYAVDYALNGNKPVFDDYSEDDKAAKEQWESVYAIPDSIQSVAKQYFLQAVSIGIDGSVAKEQTCGDLERMISVAMINKGVDVCKSKHMQNAGAFYVASGKIHQRLIEEKKEKK